MLERIKKIVLIIFGNFLVATGTVFFVVPAGLITGGATGVSLVLNQYLHIPISVGIAIVCGILLLLGLITLGKEFFMNTAVSAVSFPASVAACEFIAERVNFTTDSLVINLACAIILYGFGTATVMRQGASSGGLDTIAVILNRKRGWPLATMVNIFEVLAMIPQLIYSSVDGILGGVLLTVGFTSLMNHFIASGGAKVQVMVYTSKYEEINEYINTKLGRGSTLYEIQGGYTREESYAVQTIVDNRELFRLKEEVLRIDPAAFMTISEVSQVSGKGFTLAKEHRERPQVKPDSEE